MPHHPSADPDPTAAHRNSPDVPSSDTLDVTRAKTTPPSDAPAAPDGVPVIPGYEVTAELARGGMGRVYAGHDLTLDREVAIKTLLPGANPDRFVTESKITARLPHPGIPPVYALGTLADGSPYLAMKRIRGRTLAPLLTERASPRAELPRFVQVFEQVAQAVGFAHSRGIVHRDLKPLNVMVGEFGEVQVMDWGLAKDTASPGREAGDDPADPDHLDRTRAGTVMGTPGYMAPEQARGEAVDARADVFALGGILAAILTGKPAFVGTTARETIDKAAKADLADVLARLDACGADVELVSVARRCLAAEAAGRPADARQVAAEVAAYRAGVEARLRQAETDRARAETRAAEQSKRRRVVQWAGGAIAAVLVAGLGVSLWQMNRAITAEDQARDSEQAAIQERDAKGAALAAETKARAAERVALDRARTALRSLTEDIVEKQMARGTKLTEENKEFLRAILKQYEALAAITGDDAESRGIRAEGLGQVGVMRSRLGELKEAEAAYADALALYVGLAADFPTTPEYRSHLARVHNNLGVLLQATDRPKEGEAAYTTALAIRRQLAADFPTDPEFRADLAKSHNVLGVLLETTGRPEEAEAAYAAARAIYKQLAADFPTVTEFRSGLARSHNNLGILMRNAGRYEEAEAAYAAALAIHKQLATDFPDVTEFRSDLAGSHHNLGVLLQTTGRDAEAAFAAALAIYKQLAADFPTVTEFRADLAKGYNSLGIVLRIAGRHEEAADAFAASLAIRKRLAADFPTVTEFRSQLARTHNSLGNLLRATGRYEEAASAYAAALAVYKQLVADFPTVPGHQIDVGGCYGSMGFLLGDTGKAAESLAWFADSIAVLQAVWERQPTHPTARQYLCNSHRGRALSYDMLAKYAEAVADWDRAVELSPPDGQRNLRALRAESQMRAGQVAAAVAEIAELTKLPLWNANRWYNFACIYAVAASKDAARKTEYSDRAMELLQRAVKAGYKDAAHMRKDTDLDPLRDRDDFRTLLAELEEKKPQPKNPGTNTHGPPTVAPPPRAK